MAASCVICNNSQAKNADCVLFPFPEKTDQPVLYQKYLTLCDLNEATISNRGVPYVCSLHYEESCFEDGSEQKRLKDGVTPSLNMDRIEIETYVDDDFQILDEYIPLFNIKQGASTAGTAPSSDQFAMDTTESEQPSVETLLVPKTEPMEGALEEVMFDEAEVKTEAPEVDEGIPDPFDSVEPAQSSEGNAKYCILCGDNETKSPDCRLYVFPRRIPKIYRKWMIAAGLDANQYKEKDIYSCQRHFPENGFFADGKFIQSWATPKLNLPIRKKPVGESTITASSKPQIMIVNPTPGTSTGGSSSAGPQIIIKSNPANRKNAEALNIDPDSYAKTFARVVMELVPKKLNYNGEERPVTGTIVFQSNLF